MEAKHTPGPWKTGREHGGYTVINSGEWAELAKVVTRLVEDREVAHDGIANARLIAAAPDLYDALREVFEYLDAIPESAVGGDDDAVWLARKARAAIAKAEGK